MIKEAPDRDMKELENLDDKIKKCKQKLYETFANNICDWWKEEDLQSYLYLLLVGELGTKLVHREYRLKGVEPDKRKWIAVIDLVVLQPFDGEFSYSGREIRHAIQLKFPRKYDTGFSSGTANELERNYEIDRKLFSEEAKNVIASFKKHILFFRRFKSKNHVNQMHRDESRKKLDELLKDKSIQFSYMEAYTDSDERHSPLFNNCGLKEEVSRAIGR